MKTGDELGAAESILLRNGKALEKDCKTPMLFCILLKIENFHKKGLT